MAVLVVILLCFGVPVPRPGCWPVPALVLQSVFNAGLAMIMARLGAKTPDIAQLMPFMLRTWMYVSGVMWSLDQLLSKHSDLPHWVGARAAGQPGRRLHRPDAVRPDRQLPRRSAAAARVADRDRLGRCSSASAGSSTSGRLRRRTAVAEQHGNSRRTQVPTVVVDGVAHRLPRQRHRRRPGLAPPPPSTASLRRKQTEQAAGRPRGARGQGRVLHRLPGRGDRPDRHQRLRQVDAAPGGRRPAPGGERRASTPTASPPCSA